MACHKGKNEQSKLKLTKQKVKPGELRLPLYDRDFRPEFDGNRHRICDVRGGSRRVAARFETLINE